MVEFTCIICGLPYNVLHGVPEERMCHNCFEYDDIMDDSEERNINEEEEKQ